MRGPFVVWSVDRREDHVELDVLDLGEPRFRAESGRVWTDTPANQVGALVASEKLVGLFKALYVPHVEYLPAYIEGLSEHDLYFVVRPVGEVADLADVPADRQIFQVAGRPGRIYFRSSLAELLDQVGIVGPSWTDPAHAGSDAHHSPHRR